jgi:transcriptional antiterminator RfaH
MHFEIQNLADTLTTFTRSWFCVRSHPKREHIAAAHLRRLDGVDVFSPRLRIKKATRRGPVTFVESLFPNYLFARFDARIELQSVRHSPSVSTVVHFGTKLPQIPDEVIEELQASFPEGEIQEFDRDVRPGDEVTIAHGPFAGLQGKVLRVLAPQQRVQVLLEMLGRSTPVIVNPNALIMEDAVLRMSDSF